MSMMEQDIAATAERLRNLGVPDHLNRWINMTPAAWRSNEERRRALREGVTNMAKIGQKEQQLRDARAADQQPGQASTEAQQESPMRKTTTKPPAKGKTKKAAATATKKVDRTPKTIAEFVVAGGEAGVAMADIEKKFAMKAHPLRSKIFAARHELGYQIEYVPTTKRYVGKAPPTKAAA